jgi:hypothetical protein
MQLYARIEAFTMLGVVHLAATVRTDIRTAATEPLLTLSTEFRDDGETDPRAWLRDALVALLEVT